MPDMFGGSHLPAHELFLRHVEGITVENLRSISAAGDPRDARFSG
jgi:hypothetical protein